MVTSMLVANTKALISCAVTMQLIFTFVLAYAKYRFSHDGAKIIFHFLSRYLICLGG